MQTKGFSNQLLRVLYKFIPTIPMYKSTCAILVLIILQSNICWAEDKRFPYDKDNKNTFYGRVVKPPPHFEYAHDYDKNFCFEGRSLHGIFDELREILTQMMDELGCRYALTILSPPYYVEDSDWDYFGLIDRLAKWWPYKFILRESPITTTFQDPIMNYSESMQKIDFLNYWTILCYDIEIECIENEIKAYREELLGACDERKETILHNTSCCQESLQAYERLKKNELRIISSYPPKIHRFYTKLYNIMGDLEDDPKAIYQKGRLLFDSGKNFEFIKYVRLLINKGYSLTPEASLLLGRSYNEINLFNQAIQVLSDLIQNNPSMKEAYFERAIAYFELGKFEMALDDYLRSGKRPHFLSRIKNEALDDAKFYKGIALGCLEGGEHSLVDFVPSLFSTMYGLGKGIWAFASHPIDISVELAMSCRECMDYLVQNVSLETLKDLAPELKNCIDKWNGLEEEQKGRYIGYIIGRYGTDILMLNGLVRGVKLARNLKEANSAMVFERAAMKGLDLEEINLAAQKHFKAREEYCKSCRLHLGHHEKHVRGAKGFIEGRSEITLAADEIQCLAQPYLGTGIATRCSLGEAGYKEVVDFGKEIGVHVEFETRIRTPTRIGEIHYNKNGEYHIVPVHPKKVDFLNG